MLPEPSAPAAHRGRSHAPPALANLDQLLVMAGGMMQAFGAKDQVLGSVTRSNARCAAGQDCCSCLTKLIRRVSARAGDEISIKGEYLFQPMFSTSDFMSDVIARLKVRAGGDVVHLVFLVCRLMQSKLALCHRFPLCLAARRWPYLVGNNLPDHLQQLLVLRDVGDHGSLDPHTRARL